MSKRRPDFADLFKVEASKEAIQGDVLKMLEDLRAMAETSDGTPADLARYEPYAEVADAIRADVEGSQSGKRTRKRKRVFEIERKPTRRRVASRAAFRSAGAALCQGGVCVGS